MSGVTTNSAPDCRWSCTLSWPILADTGSSKTEKVPPKPQHSSGRFSGISSSPCTPASSAAGLLKAGSSTSDVLAPRSARSVEQPRCRLTLCGKRAQGNSRTPSTSCTKLTSSMVFFRTACTSGVCGTATRWSRTWWVQLPEGATMWS